MLDLSLSILQVCTVKTRQIGIQTDPMPVEFDELVAEEKRKEEEEKKRKEEEERLAREAEDKELEARKNHRKYQKNDINCWLSQKTLATC